MLARREIPREQIVFESRFDHLTTAHEIQSYLSILRECQSFFFLTFPFSDKAILSYYYSSKKAILNSLKSSKWWTQSPASRSQCCSRRSYSPFTDLSKTLRQTRNLLSSINMISTYLIIFILYPYDFQLIVLVPRSVLSRPCEYFHL